MAPDHLDDFGEDLERRGNGVERDRIATLAKHFARIARNLDTRERALERAVRILIGATLIAFGFGIYLGVSVRQQANETNEVAAEQEAARYRAVYSACLERNKISDNIVTFLVEIGASGQTVRKAHERFPREPDCRLYTVSLLGKKAPRGAFDIPEIIKRRVAP